MQINTNWIRLTVVILFYVIFSYILINEIGLFSTYFSPYISIFTVYISLGIVFFMYMFIKFFLLYRSNHHVIVPLNHDISKGLYMSGLILAIIDLLVALIVLPLLQVGILAAGLFPVVGIYYLKSKLGLGFTKNLLILENRIWKLNKLLSYEFRKGVLYLSFGRKVFGITFYTKVDLSLT